MKTEIIPLADRLDRLSNNQAAHPEYDSAVIRSMARMPIMAYMSDYDILCDFQCIVGGLEYWPYQVMARVIADRVHYKEISPEDLAEAVNILAAPVVRIDEAYHRKDSSLLPRRKPEKSVSRQERLAWRLDNAGTLAGPPYNLHRMPIGRFFAAVSALTGDPKFLSNYRSSILPHMSDDRTLFREAVYEISVRDIPGWTDLLYKILVESFAELPNTEREVT